MIRYICLIEKRCESSSVYRKILYFFTFMYMLQTKIKKTLAVVALASISMTSMSSTNATDIGTGSITGSGWSATPIVWNDIFGVGSSASGSVTDVLIKARVLPTLNMEISAEEIDLGDLVAGIPSSGSLDIEIGTNAVTGVSITARSQSGGLTNTADAGTQINDLTADEVAESYTWESTPAAANDSSFAAFAATGLTSLEINDNVTEHTVYSSNKPEATAAIDDVNFAVTATTSAQTPAGLYEDLVTFTVSANF